MGDVEKKPQILIELNVETTISEMKNIPDGINGRLDIAGKKDYWTFRYNGNYLKWVPGEGRKWGKKWKEGKWAVNNFKQPNSILVIPED